MSKEKQIEEMWNIITTDCDNECVGCEFENDNWCFTHRVINDLYNAGYRKQSEWISVYERLPEVDKNVLVITVHGSFKVARCNIYKNGTEVIWATNDGLGERAITHWMPLPEPPKMKGSDNEQRD
jgi:hypothetical protein